MPPRVESEKDMGDLETRVRQLEQLPQRVTAVEKELAVLAASTGIHLGNVNTNVGRLEKTVEAGFERLNKAISAMESKGSFVQGGWWGAARVAGAIGFAITGLYGVIKILEIVH